MPRYTVTAAYDLSTDTFHCQVLGDGLAKIADIEVTYPGNNDMGIKVTMPADAHHLPAAIILLGEVHAQLVEAIDELLYQADVGDDDPAPM